MRCDVKRLNGYGTLDGLALPRAIERKKETGTRETNSSRSNAMQCNVKRLNRYGTLDGLALPRTIERKKETGTRGTNSKETITGAMIRRYRKNGAQEEGQQERRQRRERERGGEYDIGNAYLHVPCGEKCKEREEREE